MILLLLPAGLIFVTPAQADLAEQFFDPVEVGLGMTGLFFHESDEDAAVRKEAML